MALDAVNPLLRERERFVITDPDLLYLDGNSLGRMPRAAVDVIEHTTHHQWGDRLIRSWNEGWWELQLRLGEVLAPVIGARPGETIISESTSTNLFKLVAAALRARPGRTRIVTDDLNFPSDNYILDGVARLLDRGHEVVTVGSLDGVHGPTEAIEAALDRDTAVLVLGHTCFRSGFTYDMGRLTAAAHAVGALVVWDCSHSVGAVPIAFAEDDVDLAVGCTYKYLNGGPGSPAFLYVNQRLQRELENPITGWWGHAAPFAFEPEFRPDDAIRRYHVGTMPTLSLAAVEPGITHVAEVGTATLREVSVALTEDLVQLVDEHLAGFGFTVASPRDPAERGSHVGIAHPDAWPINRALIEEAKVLPDFRAPDVIRLGVAPLYIGHVDLHTAVLRIRHVVEQGLHEAYRGTDAAVT